MGAFKVNNPENKNYEPHPNEAWSDPGSEMPWDTIWTEKGKSGETYYFARDDKGDLYYQSESGRRFAKEMEEAQKRRAQEKERPRYKKMA